MRASWLPSSLAGIWWRKIWLLPVATWFPTHSILWWVDDVLIFSDESQQVHQGKHYPWVVCTALASSGWSWNDLRCICLQELSVLICSVPALENKKVLNHVLIFALHETSGLLSAADHWSQASSQNKHGHVTEQERSAAGNLAINPLPLISFPHPFFWFNSWMWPRDPAGSSGCGPIWLTYTWLPPSYSHDSWLEERYFLYNSFFSCSSLCWRSYFARAKRTEVSKHTCRTVCM